MNIQPTPSQLRHHEAHKAAQQRLWGKPKPAKPQLVIVARNDRPPVDASYHMVLYRSYLESIRERFALSGSFEFKQNQSFFSHAQEINYRKTMRQIALEVLSGFPGIRLEDLKSKVRTRAVVDARHRVLYEIARQLPGKSYPEMGRFMGGIDHTAVLHAVRKLRAIYDGDADGIAWMERKTSAKGARHD